MDWTASDLALAAHWTTGGPTAGPFGGAGPTWAKALDLGLDRDPNARDQAFRLALTTLDTHRTRLALAGAYLALGGHPHNLLAWGFTNLQAAKALARGLTLWSRGRLFFSTWYAR